MIMIFCNDKRDIYISEIKCYKGIYIIYSILSIICQIILFFQGLLFTSFYFKKVENTNYEMVKFLIVNSPLSFFFVKSVSVIIGGICIIYHFTNYAIFILLVMALYNSYNYCIELKYLDQDENSFQFFYYFHIIYFLSCFFCAIGFLLKKKSFKGLFYVFFMSIFLYIIYNLSKSKEEKILSFQHIKKNINNEFTLFLQARYLTHAVEKKKISRYVLLNLLSYYSQMDNIEEGSISDINKKLGDENLMNNNTEDIDLSLYQTIDKFYKVALQNNMNSIILKISYSNFLRHKLKRYTKAYMILVEILEEEDYLSFSEDFYCYRLKRKIEDRFIETGIDKSEISYKYQCNTLINLISKVSSIYLDLWNLLLNNKSEDNIFRLNEFGNEINIIIEQIEYKFKCILKMKIKNKKIILLYGLYLKDIINDIEKSNKILTPEFITEVDNEKNIEETLTLEYGIDSIPSSSLNYIIISAKINQIGVIKKISTEICKILGYSSRELIGQNLNILIPEMLKYEHDILINDRVSKLKFNVNVLEKESCFRRNIYFKTFSKNIVNMELEVKNGYDEELNPFLLCKINYLNEDFLIKNNTVNYYILTNANYIIQSWSSNCYQEFSLCNTMMDNNIDILSHLLEFTKIYLKRTFGITKKEKRDKIKYLILKELYIISNFKEIVTWKLTNKQYFMICEEIKINNKLLAFVFNFKKNIFEETPNLNKKSKIPNLTKGKIKTFKKCSKSLYQFKSNNINNFKENNESDSDFAIENNYIPKSFKTVQFNGEEKEYIFLKKNKKKSFLDITDFLKEEFLKQIKEKEKENCSEETEEEENESLSYSSYSSSFSSNNEKNNDINKEEENDIKNTLSFRNIKINDNIYKVNLKNMNFMFYDFRLNMISPYNFKLKGKVEEIFETEKKKTFNIINTINTKKENEKKLKKFKKKN